MAGEITAPQSGEPPQQAPPPPLPRNPAQQEMLPDGQPTGTESLTLPPVTMDRAQPVPDRWDGWLLALAAILLPIVVLL